MVYNMVFKTFPVRPGVNTSFEWVQDNINKEDYYTLFILFSLLHVYINNQYLIIVQNTFT